MRFTALFPALLCTVALILTFLCLFAGSSKGFMQDYAVVTLNTSQIGYNVFNASLTGDCNDSLINCFLQQASQSIQSQLQGAVNTTTQVGSEILSTLSSRDCTDPLGCAAEQAGDAISNSLSETANSTTQLAGDVTQDANDAIESGLSDTLNTTTQIGNDLLNSSSTSNAAQQAGDAITQAGDALETGLSEVLNTFAKVLGVSDFYSAHLLNFCEGYYTPTAVPNATLHKDDIKHNVTHCSSAHGMYWFNPEKTLEQQLAKSGVNIDLSELQWPDEINNGLQQLKVAQRTAFVLYCIAIAVMFVAIGLAVASVFFSGKLSAIANVLVDCVALLAVGIASIISTAIAVKATHIINKYGDGVGVSATSGGKFIALTWVTTAIMFAACLVWCAEVIMSSRRGQTSLFTRKLG